MDTSKSDALFLCIGFFVGLPVALTVICVGPLGWGIFLLVAVSLCLVGAVAGSARARNTNQQAAQSNHVQNQDPEVTEPVRVSTTHITLNERFGNYQASPSPQEPRSQPLTSTPEVLTRSYSDGSSTELRPSLVGRRY